MAEQIETELVPKQAGYQCCESSGYCRKKSLKIKIIKVYSVWQKLR